MGFNSCVQEACSIGAYTLHWQEGLNRSDCVLVTCNGTASAQLVNQTGDWAVYTFTWRCPGEFINEYPFSLDRVYYGCVAYHGYPVIAWDDMRTCGGYTCNTGELYIYQRSIVCMPTDCGHGTLLRTALYEFYPRNLWSSRKQFCKLTESEPDYAGNLRNTLSGLTCQKWDTDSPHVNNFKDPSLYPDESLAAADNYCRSPDPEFEGGPWCYTTDPAVERMLCNVVHCDEMFIDEEAIVIKSKRIEDAHLLVDGVSDTCANLGIGHSSIKFQLPATWDRFYLRAVVYQLDCLKHTSLAMPRSEIHESDFSFCGNFSDLICQKKWQTSPVDGWSVCTFDCTCLITLRSSCNRMDEFYLNIFSFHTESKVCEINTSLPHP